MQSLPPSARPLARVAAVPARSPAPAPAPRWRTLAVLVAGVPVLAGCGALGADGGSGEPQVVAAFYPLQYVTERIAGEHVTVSNLTATGSEPHDLELTVKETADLAAADLVVVESGFQPAVDDAVAGRDPGTVVDAADVVELQPVADHSEEGHSEEDHDADEHADEDAADHADEGHDEHEHGDLDPHFWLDPLRMADLGDAVADRLAEAAPDAAADFEENAAALRADLERLDAEYADRLASCERDTVVVNHDAFGYLAKYGLHLEPVLGLSPDAEPTPATLSRLQRLIRDEGVTTVFAETLGGRQAVGSLADDLGLEVQVLDPVEGLTDETRDEDYLSLMRTNLDRLSEANDC